MNQIKEYIDKFLHLPLLHRIIASCLFFICCGFSFWQFSYSELVLESSELTAKYEQLSDEILRKQRLVSNLSKYQAQVKTMDEQLSNVLRELPDKKEIDSFLRSISILAVDIGLEVIKFTPLPESRKEYFANIPVNMQLEGSFHQLVTFFDELAHLPRIVNISNINIGLLSIEPEEVIINASCQATTFRYLDEAERPKPILEAAGDAKRRRKR